MSATYLAHGIVLAHRDTRDVDRIVTIFTDRYGKFDAIARGVRKITSKLAGHLEPLSYSSFMFANGKTLDVLASSVKQSSFRLPHSDLLGFALASYFFEAVNALTRPRQPDRRIFRLCVNYLHELEHEEYDEHAPSFQRLLLTEFCLWQLLEAVGFGPSLDHCVICRKTDDAFRMVSVRKGGVLCREHEHEDDDALLCSAEALDVIRLMADGNHDVIRLLNRSRSTIEHIDQLLARTIEYHIEKTIASRQFLSVCTTLAP